ncbi:MAG: hypothetical protein IJ941_01070, partial [Clostridia bacterium]|nr:hypothetical protein [Clostridia bacterium]
MKKCFVIFICILLSLALMTGCGKKQEQEETSLFAIDPLSMDSAPTPQPQSSAEVQGLEVVAVNQPTVSADPAAAPAPAVTVTDTVAYVFDGAEGPTLYGGLAYQNTGNC